jgi:SAM-dependent methyltransferase
MKTGLTPWHFICAGCAYESAALEPAINQSTTHELLDEDQREIALKQLRNETFKRIVARARQHAPAGRRTLLDVGSAHGWFLEQAMAQFDVVGIEPDAAVGSKAAARGLPVRPGYFPQALEAGESFDVIVFNDVIEHIPDIQAALDECRKRLNSNGLLMLNLPCSGGFFYRTAKVLAALKVRGPFDRMWQKSLPSPHVHYFNPVNLPVLVGRAGFTCVESFELPSVRPEGLLERIRCVGNNRSARSYFQYLLIRAMIPFLRLFQSDIIVCVFRKT